MNACKYTGCNSPQGECSGACLARQHIVNAKQRIADQFDDDTYPEIPLPLPARLLIVALIALIALALVLPLSFFL